MWQFPYDLFDKPNNIKEHFLCLPAIQLDLLLERAIKEEIKLKNKKARLDYSCPYMIVRALKFTLPGIPMSI